MADIKGKQASAQRIEKERQNFRSLVIANPNYFGNFPATELPVVKKIATNTNYEELISAGYNPRVKQLHATVDIKRTGGYGGDLCAHGSFEYVRFYVDHGAGWVDAGMAATRVHDIPAGKDCAGAAHHPLTYAVTVPYSPQRRWCFFPQLPRMRAILSWSIEPPAGQPDWVPVYGNVRECNIQIDKSPFILQFLDDLVAKFDVPIEVVESVKPLLPPIDPDPPEFEGLIPIPDPPLPNPPPPLTSAQLAERYAIATRARRQRFAVEPTRFAFAEVQALMAAPALDLDSVATLQGVFGPIDVDFGDLVAEIEDTTGNISYEELVDVGLDTNRERLVATYHVKKPSGFSGGLCSAGSLEHVAFWADWDGDCNWEYLDTVSLRAYDFEDLPDGGLCYSLSLPVDLERFERHCSEPNVARVRAVLSWSTPPSTVDPDEVPTWGNRLDAHVLVPVRVGVPGTLTRIGGINVAEISDLTGMAAPSATLMPIGMPVDSGGHPAPFGARLLIVGPEVPGKRYRLHVIDGGGGSTTLMSTIYVGDGASPTPHSPDPAGWYQYLPFTANPDRLLGYFNSSGNDLVRVVLEIEGIGVVDSQRVQLDNIRPEVSISITEPVTDCGKVPAGVLLKGRVHATDAHMLRWKVVIDGGPSSFHPHNATSGGSGTTNTPSGGVEWTYQTDVAMPPCGYVVRVTATDRTIVNSGLGHYWRSTDVGFCVES